MPAPLFPQSAQVLRKLIESPQFESECSALGDRQRLDDALSATTFSLARNPQHQASRVAGTTSAIYAVELPILWFQTADEIVRPRFLLYFTFNDSEVELLSIRPRDADSESE